MWREYKERERERKIDRPGKCKRESPGQWRDLLSTICRPCLHPFILSLCVSPVKTRIFHSDVLAARRVTVAAVRQDAAIKCCRTGIVQRQKGISAFTRAKLGQKAFRLFSLRCTPSPMQRVVVKKSGRVDGFQARVIAYGAKSKILLPSTTHKIRE